MVAYTYAIAIATLQEKKDEALARPTKTSFEDERLEIAREVATRSGTCLDKSRMLVEELHKKGYQGRIIVGYYNGQPHAWVESGNRWIEATTGSYIYDKSGYEIKSQWQPTSTEMSIEDLENLFYLLHDEDEV